MKTVYFISLLSILSLTAEASASIGAVAPNANVGLCPGIAIEIETCQTARKAIADANEKLSRVDPSSSEFKSLSDFISEMQPMCDILAEDTSVPMVTAQVRFDAPATIASAGLDHGILGRVDFRPKQTNGDSILISAPLAQMTVYGPFYCQALTDAGGDQTKAVTAILQEITGKN